MVMFFVGIIIHFVEKNCFLQSSVKSGNYGPHPAHIDDIRVFLKMKKE